jgi:Flp pilus assembly protein TadG
MGSMHATLDFLTAFLGTRVTRLRDARRHKDRGASAVELAIITAVIIGIAGIVLAAINIFVTNESAKINGG